MTQFSHKKNYNSVKIYDYTYVQKVKLINNFAMALKYQAYENEFQHLATRFSS